jgi:methanethiol S-methyltransferase
MTKNIYKFISNCSVFIGSLSFLLFFCFIFFGPLDLIDFKLGRWGIIIFDAFLSFLFFLQHSLVIRITIRNKIIKMIPEETFYAFYSILSGLNLILFVLFWQKSSYLVFAVSEPYLYLLRFLSIAAVLGLIWGVKSLSSFDPFGRRKILKHIGERKEVEGAFVSRGAYNVTRHPFYFFILLMIWSFPVLTIDRLLFAFLWTTWIIIGTILEERDLVEEIGNDYREYQKKVSMLIPYKFF